MENKQPEYLALEQNSFSSFNRNLIQIYYLVSETVFLLVPAEFGKSGDHTWDKQKMSMVIKGLWEVLNLSVDALSSETLPYSQSYIITFPSFSLTELSKIKTDLLSLRNIYHTQEK